MISLHEPSFDATDEEYVLETLRSSWVSTGGPFVDRFEREFANFVGAKHAVSVMNGTAAIHLALDALTRIKGFHGPFECMVPSLTFVATASALVQAGGRPVFVDVEKDTFHIDVEKVRETFFENYGKEAGLWVSKHTRLPLLGVMPVHIMGWTCDMQKLRLFCDEFDLALVEDAAEAFGSYEHSGVHVGTQGLASCFSFNGNKILSTGAGGMIVTNSSPFAARLKHLSTTAKIDNLRFVHDEAGYNYRMPNIVAALGCSQLAKMPARLTRKKQIFERYQKAFEGTAVKVYKDASCVSNHWLVNAVFSSFEDRERALNALISKNIQARPLWTPIHLQPSYKIYNPFDQKFPQTESMWQRVLSLPSSPQLSDETIDEIARILLQSQTLLERVKV